MPLSDIRYERSTPETSWVYGQSPSGRLSAGVTARASGVNTGVLKMGNDVLAEMIGDRWAPLDKAALERAGADVVELLDVLAGQLSHVKMGDYRKELGLKKSSPKSDG